MAPPPPPNQNPPVTNATTSSVRRNLFSSHLSRRPASSTSNTSSTNDLSTLQSALAAHHSHSHLDDEDDIPSDDIILRDAQTGRPTLPLLPTLPTHLRLSPSASEQHMTDPGETDYTSQLELEDAMREKEDKERIEKSLVEMMYRSRSRAHGHATRHHGGTGAGGGSGGGAGSSGGGGGGVGTFGPEHEELLALVQASLRKKVAGLEEDRWMFEGENNNGK